MPIVVDVSQLEVLAADLARAGINIRNPVGGELRTAAKEIRRKGRELVRKRTGRTARSITYQSRKRGLQFEVGPTWFVGRFLEHGTVKMRPYPFMAPAAAQQVVTLPDRIAEAAANAMLTGDRSMPSSLI
jgi:HK97 gp10 family phage protein